MPSINPSIQLLDPNMGIMSVLDSIQPNHMPGARPMASNVMREAGLEELYAPGTTARQMEAALCPLMGDGEALRPDVFSANLAGSMEALSASTDPAVRAFVEGELRPLMDNNDLLKAYTGLMIGG